MTAEAALFLNALNAGSANDLRHMLSGYFGGRIHEAIAPGSGAIGRGHGVLSPDAMAVTAQATANNTVRVAPGFAVVRGSQNNAQGSYLCPLDNSTDLEIADKDASLTRIDWVIARVLDASYAGVDDEWELQIVTGTPGGAAPSVPEDSLALAQISVAPGVGSTIITSAAITDYRPHARTSGGIQPVATTADFPNPKDFDTVYDISTSHLLIYYSGSWLIVGNDYDVGFQTYTPLMTGVVTLGAGGTRYGKFKRYGKTVVGTCGFFGGGAGWAISSVTPLRITLPSTAANLSADYMAICNASLNLRYYSGTGLILKNTNMVQFVNSYGSSSWIGPSNPASWGVANQRYFNVLFVYEEA